MAGWCGESGSSVWTNGSEVAEQIKRIKTSLFTDTSKLLLPLSFKTILPRMHTHKYYPSSMGGQYPQRHFQSVLRDLRWKDRACAACYQSLFRHDWMHILHAKSLHLLTERISEYCTDHNMGWIIWQRTLRHVLHNFIQWDDDDIRK